MHKIYVFAEKPCTLKKIHQEEGKIKKDIEERTNVDKNLHHIQVTTNFT